MDQATRELLQALRATLARHDLEPEDRGYVLELVDEVLAGDLDPQRAVERIRQQVT